MLIDWFTVAAQLINFIALVWLLKRFLYQPILQALNQREQKITAELAAADAQKQQALQQSQAFELKNQTFEQQRAALLTEAIAEANSEKQRLLAAAQQEAQALRTKWQQALADEYQLLTQEITAKTQAEVFAIAAKTLTDLADMRLELRIIEVFTHQIQLLTVSEREQWQVALSAANESLRVRTAFALSDTDKQQLATTLKNIFVINGDIVFEVTPHLISGIEVCGNGQKLAWTISHYLHRLQNHLSDMLSPPAFAPAAVD